MNLLETNSLNKFYGKFQALKDISVTIPKGKIVSILGPNGAGKTTFIKIIAGLIHQNSGTILLNGNKITSKTKSLTAYLPDKNFLYQWFTVSDAIDYFNCFFEDFNKETAKKLIKEMDISEKQKIRSCSKGMQERINMALTLSRKAKLFVFDEPLAAVDPLTRDFIIEAIKNNIDRDNASMLISTHLVNDVESLFDDVIIISDGKLLLSGNVEELKEKHKMNLENLFKEVIRNAA
ncbi:MAG: ABC transporter ATP-binding protein [Oscillospiraceae bacterium]|jgi:ABC-2 type transport system ATP-binding protein|nr:ABC transporter ATP-binding protein [Oscillospiraceae bacterium]